MSDETYPNMHVATFIIAPNDSSGNPRTGYVVRKVVLGQSYGEGPTTFIEAGYEGEEALRDRFPGAIVTCSVWVTIGEWRSRVRGEGARTAAEYIMGGDAA